MPSNRDETRREFLGALRSLQPRHRWTLEQLIEGKTNREIAAAHEPPLALHSVELYVSHILQATRCRNRAELMRKTFEHVLRPQRRRS